MEDAENNQHLSDQLKYLTDTVDRLSLRLDNYIETVSSRTPVYNVGTITREAPYVAHSSLSDRKTLTSEQSSSQEDGDENEERGNWSSQMDFILSCLGYAVGLGNVWRFPYKAYKNGGGAFLIPYVVMLVFVGIPIFFMELALGQYTSSGPLTCWKFSPMFTGIGYGMVLVSSFVSIYYNMIIAWSIYYLVASFTTSLPWATCDNDWNTPYCSLNLPDVNCSQDVFPELLQHVNGTCLNTTTTEPVITGLWNSTIAAENGIRRVYASEEYYKNKVLGLSGGLEEIGEIRWELALCLLAAWVIVFLCLIKGVKSSGKVVYFTALFPYVVLVILLVRGLTLDGFEEGIIYYVTPDWERLKDAAVWNDAANQIFFSLSASWGGLITLSSYNRFHNNILRDTFIVTLGNCLTSVFAGFVIFSFLGFMAAEQNTAVENVVDSGAGLAFVVYPAAVTELPLSPLWAILFFVMLLTLGLDSQFTLMETVVTALLDRWPSTFDRKRKALLLLLLCVVFFFVGLILTTNGGAYVLELLDNYAGGWAVLTIALCECIATVHVYGWGNFSKDIGLMLGSRPNCLWLLCWMVLTPMVILYVLFFSWADYSPLTYGSHYTFDLYANAIGWLITVSIVLPIPVVMVIMFCRAEGGFVQRMRQIGNPNREWGPALVKHRALVTHLKNFVVDPQYNTEVASSRLRDQGIDNSAYAQPAI